MIMNRKEWTILHLNEWPICIALNSNFGTRSSFTLLIIYSRKESSSGSESQNVNIHKIYNGLPSTYVSMW